MKERIRRIPNRFFFIVAIVLIGFLVLAFVRFNHPVADSVTIDMGSGPRQKLITATLVPGRVKNGEMESVKEKYGRYRVADGDIFFIHKSFLTDFTDDIEKEGLLLQVQENNQVSEEEAKEDNERYDRENAVMMDKVKSLGQKSGMTVYPPRPPLSSQYVNQGYTNSVPMQRVGEYFAVKIRERYKSPVFGIRIGQSHRYLPHELMMMGKPLIDKNDVVENQNSGYLFVIKPF